MRIHAFIGWLLPAFKNLIGEFFRPKPRLKDLSDYIREDIGLPPEPDDRRRSDYDIDLWKPPGL
jgi:hypothetical protein